METGFMNRIIGLVLALVVGGLLVGGLLIPTVEGIQTNVGETVIINNDNITPTADYTNNDFTLTVSAADDTDGYAIYVNDVGYPKPNVTKVGLISDRLYINVSSTAERAAEIRYWDSANDTEVSTNVTADITVEYSHSAHSLTFAAGTLTLEYADVPFVFVWDKNGAYGEVIQNNNYPNKAFRMESILDGSWGVFEFGAQFTIGEETHRGMITVSKYGLNYYFAGDPDWTVDFVYGTPTLKEGTTDLYDGLQPQFIISDGNGNTVTIDPYRSFILNEASGHATSGAYYVMFGVISLLGIIMLIVVAANAIRNKY